MIRLDQQSRQFNSVLQSPSNGQKNFNERTSIKNGKYSAPRVKDQKSPKFNSYNCPISGNIMVEPVNLPTGHIISAASLVQSFDQQREENPQIQQMMCPVSKQMLPKNFKM